MLFGSAKGNQKPGKEARSIKALKKEYSNIDEILNQLGVPTHNKKSSLAYLCEESGINVQDVFDLLDGKNSIQATPDINIESLTIYPGSTKDNEKEFSEPLIIKKGEIIAIVGPTGSGKSQLLNDIEGLAQGDSPSGRRILLNGKEIDDEVRFDNSYKPIAQISQNMNYLLDISVDEFVDIHFDCKGKKSTKADKKNILETACSLSGESFTGITPLASLSGGQARALMIADAVKISCSPIILVDEIENAGIDKVNAVQLLLKGGNITFIATHDPLIGLMAHKRFILKNGGIANIIERSGKEIEALDELKNIDYKLSKYRQQLRSGENISTENLPE